MVTAQYRNKEIGKTEQVAMQEHTWNTRASMIVLFTILSSFMLPMLLGRIGFALATLATAACVALLVGSSLKLGLTRLQVFGLMLLTITFMNIDAITSAPELRNVPRLSWMLTGLFIPYAILASRSLVWCLKRNPLLLLFVAFTAVRIIWSLQTGSLSTVTNILQRDLFYLLVFLIVADLLTASRRTALGIFYMLVLAGISSAMMLGAEYYAPETLGMSRTILLSGALRTAGLYINANAAAFAISFAAVVLAWLVGMKKFPRNWGMLCFLVLTLGTLATFSRKGALWITIALVGLFPSFLPKSRADSPVAKALGMGMAIAALMLIGTLVLTPENISKWGFHGDVQRRLIQIGSLLSGSSESYLEGLYESGRGSLLQLTWQAIQKSPWFGYGTGLYARFQPHNLFLLLWVENGVFILFYFCGLLAAIMYNVVRSERAERLLRLLVIAHLLVFMLGAHTLFSNRYGAVMLAALFVVDKISLQGENHAGIRQFHVDGSRKG